MNKHYIYTVTIFALLMATFPIMAQVIEPLPAAMFIETQMNARDAAMGGVSNISKSSAFGVFSNSSANLFSKDKIEVGTSLSSTNDFSGNKLFSLGSYINISSNHGVSLGIRYFDYPSIDIIDISSKKEKSFAPKEMTLDLGYAYLINEKLAVSLTGRYIRSDLGRFDETKIANAIAGDLGITYKTDLETIDGGSLSLALAASNFGTKLKYTEEEYDMPAALRFGSSVHVPFNDNHKVTAALNVGYRLFPSNFKSTEAGIGAEYNLYQHGFIRAGYHVAQETKGLGDFVSLGAGIEFKPIRLDVANWIGVNDREFRNTLFINLTATF